jgi:hypothetical protein
VFSHAPPKVSKEKIATTGAWYKYIIARQRDSRGHRYDAFITIGTTDNTILSLS